MVADGHQAASCSAASGAAGCADRAASDLSPSATKLLLMRPQKNWMATELTDAALEFEMQIVTTRRVSEKSAKNLLD